MNIQVEYSILNFCMHLSDYQSFWITSWRSFARYLKRHLLVGVYNARYLKKMSTCWSFQIPLEKASEGVR